jgi:hypothetical protein
VIAHPNSHDEQLDHEHLNSHDEQLVDSAGDLDCHERLEGREHLYNHELSCASYDEILLV